MGEGARARTVSTLSVRCRLAAAIALTIGFSVLTIGLGGGLLAAAVLMVAGGELNPWVLLGCVLAGSCLLVAGLPRRTPYQAPGTRLDRARQPRLFALVEAEAAAMGVEAPEEIRATMDVGVAVTEAARGRRAMTVGLPLLHLLSERGFRGVVAREVGHFAGGDTPLAPWVLRTRGSIARTMASHAAAAGDEPVARRLVRRPYAWYGRAFLGLTGAIARRQAFAADRLAARRAGREAFAASLRRVHGCAPLFEPYWEREVVPVLRAGRRPPLARGFGLVVRTRERFEAAGEHLARALAQGGTEPGDPHPSLPERLAAVADVPVGDPDESGPAAALIEDPDGVERELAELVLGPEAASGVEPLAWEEVPSVVLVPSYAQLVRRHPSLVEGVTFAALPGAAERLPAHARRLRERDVTLEAGGAARLVADVLAAGCVLGLRDAGWAVHGLPGEPVSCERGGHRVTPRELVVELREGAYELDRYWDEVAELGIGAVRLDVAVRDDATATAAPGGQRFAPAPAIAPPAAERPGPTAEPAAGQGPGHATEPAPDPATATGP